MSGSSESGELNDEIAQFSSRAQDEFRGLFERAKAKDALQFVFGLAAEFRGAQSAGWNTAYEAGVAYNDYLDFLQKRVPFDRISARVSLALYCHLAEASGLYEIPKNMLRILDGSGTHCLPFQHLVDDHLERGRLICPNANRVFKDLAGHADAVGCKGLAEVLRDAFDADVRNAFSHADYVVWEDGINVRKRNGGTPRKILWDEFELIINKGAGLYDAIVDVAQEYYKLYDPPQQISGTFGGKLEVATVSYEQDSGGISVLIRGP